MWGIGEPLPSAPVLEPDVMLVPLLAFDARGYRLGYGGGFYDRTIAQLRNQKPVLTIGVAFDEQRVDAVPHVDYDQRLDWVLTPSGPLRCLASRMQSSESKCKVPCRTACTYFELCPLHFELSRWT